MKKFLTYLLALAALFSVAVSCNDEDDIKPGEPDVDGCFNVYFPVQDVTGLEIEPSADKTLTIIAARENTYGAITVPVELTNDYDGIFTVDDIVFADGQSESETTLYFEDAEIGVDYSFSIQVTDPQFGSLYSSSLPILDVSLAVVKWNLLTETEKALYTDDFFTTFYSVGNLTWEVDVEERDDKPGLFRILYPYDEKYAWNDPGDWDTSKDYNLIIDASDPDGVFIEQQEIGVDWGYGMISVMSVGYYDYSRYGYTWDAIKEAGECGTFKDMVVTFPTEMLLINMPEYSSSWYYANYNGAFRLSLPGAANYSVSVTAVAEDFDVTATVTFSEDVEYARVAIFEGSDIDSAVTAIERGTVEYQELSVSGDVSFTVEAGGRYSVVAVSYAEGEAKESGYATVTVTDPSETWTLYGEGSYSYSGFVFGGDDPDLEIYQSDLDKTRFKIGHWGADTDFIFEWDQDANEIYVEDQYTGYDYGAYGAVNVCDLSDSDDWGGLLTYVPAGYYNDGTFYFAVDYYCSGGEFGFGYEAFTLDGYTAAPALSDVLGTFYAYEYSVAYAGLYGSYYVIEESDDPDYDIMFTMFDYYDCDQGSIYGTYDEETGIAEFECDQMFTYYYGYYLWASLYYYYEYYPITLRFFNNGDFWGPFYGDYISEDAYMVIGQNMMYIGAWDAYAFLYCENLGVEPNSIKPASAGISEHPERTEPFDKSKVAKKTIDHKPVPAVKNASSAKTSSVSADSSKFSKKVLKDAVPAMPMH